jgi:hypothetical protein
MVWSARLLDARARWCGSAGETPLKAGCGGTAARQTGGDIEPRLIDSFGNTVGKPYCPALVGLPDEVQGPQLTVEGGDELTAAPFGAQDLLHDAVEHFRPVLDRGIRGTELEVPARAVCLAETISAPASFAWLASRARSDLTKKIRAGDERHSLILECNA